MGVREISNALGRPRGYIEAAIHQGMCAFGGRMFLSYVKDWLIRNPNPYRGRTAKLRRRKSRTK